MLREQNKAYRLLEKVFGKRKLNEIIEQAREFKKSKHFVVDIDITGFFDNIDHSKLIRQLWGLGIQDRKLIMIIKQMRLLIERCKISCNKRF